MSYDAGQTGAGDKRMTDLTNAHFKKKIIISAAKKIRNFPQRAVCVAILFAAGSLLRCTEKPPGRYNVLLIAIDDLRPELGCYGKPVLTPHIDSVASRGILYQHAYCQFSWCSPSRSSMLTGLRPDKTGVYDLKTHFRKNLPGVRTLPQYFRENGYHAAAFGKIFHNEVFLHDSLSWSEPNWLPPFDEPLYVYAREENRRLAAARKRPFAFPTESAPVNDDAYPDGMTVREAIRRLNELKDKNFFLAVGFYRPHLPYNAPQRYFDLYDPTTFILPAAGFPAGAPAFALRTHSEEKNYHGVNDRPYSDSLKRELTHGYYASVSYIDAQVGRLLKEVRNLGLGDNTIVVIWGDHGYKLGEYGHWSKHSNFDVDTRVPLIICYPGGEHRVESRIVESLDIYPTVCSLAGLPVPAGLDGSVIAGGDAPPRKDFAISQIVRDTLMGYSIRWKSVRYCRWISTATKELRAEELYDHSTDPGETRNIADRTEYSAIKSLAAEKLSQVLNSATGN